MFNPLSLFASLFARKNTAKGVRPQYRANLRVEVLEDRSCPAGVWSWNAGVLNDTLWSNPNGGNWLHNGDPAPGGDYPGKLGSAGDIVQFNTFATLSATLDVSLSTNILSLEITNWFGHTLTVNADLTVGGIAGDFLMSSGATIYIGANHSLALVQLGGDGPFTNFWSAGTIAGDSASSFVVSSSSLAIQGAPSGLGTNLLMKTADGTRPGNVYLQGMTNNLPLTGFSNILDVKSGGNLYLTQQIGVNQQPGGAGGIVSVTNPVAILVESGGLLQRLSVPIQGAPNNLVTVGGAIYNIGGTVDVGGSSSLGITGQDANNDSYWQGNSATAKLQVDATLPSFYGFLGAAGKIQIDIGTVQLNDVTGGAPTLLASGGGLIFGDANQTSFIISDITPGSPGAVRVTGNVILGQNTTTTMDYVGATNTASMLQVENGSLTLDGTLNLVSLDDQKPTAALSFFGDFGNNPAIYHDFTTIKGTIFPATYAGQEVTVSPTTLYYEVTIT